MALRDQPYLPLYVQDFLTDEKLNECSAEATGVYIKIMCVMHKSKTYGKILLRQNYQQILQQTVQQSGRQSPEFCRKFAELIGEQLARHLPFSAEIIGNSVSELLSENVLFIEDYFLCQKRMIWDNYLSNMRSEVGKKGAEASNRKFAEAKVPPKSHQVGEANSSANHSPNTENENEYNNTLTTIGNNGSVGNTIESIKDEEAELSKTNIAPRMVSYFKEIYPQYPIDLNTDFTSAISIAVKIAKLKHWSKESAVNGNADKVFDAWKKIVQFSKTDSWFCTRAISDFDKEFQRLTQTMTNKNSKNGTHKQISSGKSAGAEKLLGKLKDDITTNELN